MPQSLFSDLKMRVNTGKIKNIHFINKDIYKINCGKNRCTGEDFECSGFDCCGNSQPIIRVTKQSLSAPALPFSSAIESFREASFQESL